MLPHVLEFNLPAAPGRYAAIAVALGAEPRADCMETGKAGIAALRALVADTGIPKRLSDWKIPGDAIPEMAEAAMQITRLLKNNPREMNIDDAIRIYAAAFSV
jgi:alcohol dehydrogenase class IV